MQAVLATEYLPTAVQTLAAPDPKTQPLGFGVVLTTHGVVEVPVAEQNCPIEQLMGAESGMMSPPAEIDQFSCRDLDHSYFEC